jgi:proline-specific peptidase
MGGAMAVGVVEGFVTFEGYETRYRVVRDEGGRRPQERPPVLTLHGGPGGSADSFEPLESFAQTGRPLVLYDQASCGFSEGPEDPSQWTIALFLDQLSTVRRELGLAKLHLLGHSWGGMLA